MSYGTRDSVAGETCYRGVVVWIDDTGETRTSARGPYSTKAPCNAFINRWLKDNLQRTAPMPPDYSGTYWEWNRQAPYDPYTVVETYIEEPTGWQKVPRK